MNDDKGPLNQKKSVKHTWGGGIWTNFGHFHIFFTCSNSCKFAKKSIFFQGEGVPPHLDVEKSWIF